MDATAILSIGLSLASAVVFALVGRAIARRPVAPETATARDAFVLWWTTLAAVTLSGAALGVLGRLGVTDLVLYVVLTLALVGILCAGLWGLVYYFLVLFFNTRRLAWPLAGGYFALYFWIVYVVLARRPSGVEVTDWGVQITYAAEPHASSTLIGLLLLTPVILGALGYLSLYPRVRDPVLRRRIIIVSASILVWFGSSLPATLGLIPQGSEAWRVASRLIGLGAAGAILYAYTGLERRKAARAGAG